MSLDSSTLTQSPFTVLTLIAAPALMTNACSVLAMSTTQRMLRTREAMRELLAESEEAEMSEADGALLVQHANRIEAQAGLLLGALHSIYLALGAFSAATLVTLLGAVLITFQRGPWANVLAFVGLALGAYGVGSLIVGSVRLFRATQISLVNIHQEADLIRTRMRTLHERVEAGRPAGLPAGTRSDGQPKG
jgi:hypothetical protein